MRDMQDYFRYFDNPENFGIFITGITDHGLMGFHIWYPTDHQLKLFEGDWVAAPEYITDTTVEEEIDDYNYN